MLYHVYWQVVTDISKDRTAFVITAVRFLFLDFLPLKMVALESFETSVKIYRSTRRNIPEDLDLIQTPL